MILHKSSERPRVQYLMTQLTGLDMTSREKLSDYRTKAEGLKLDLAKVGAPVKAMKLKGLLNKLVFRYQMYRAYV